MPESGLSMTFSVATPREPLKHCGTALKEETLSYSSRYPAPSPEQNEQEVTLLTLYFRKINLARMSGMKRTGKDWWHGERF